MQWMSSTGLETDNSPDIMNHKQINQLKGLVKPFNLSEEEAQKVNAAVGELFSNPDSFIAALDAELAKRRRKQL